MLELKNLHKSFGPTAVVTGVDLAIQSGEFFSLLGPSGCGKTTLLRMLSGLEAPTRGEIFLDGRRIDTLPANQRQFNLVFQRYALFPHLTVERNVAFGLEMKQVPAQERATRVAEALALVQMEAYASRSVTTLSGGQQQRIALARAIVNRPKVLLLDEPLSALDYKLRQQMQLELVALQRRLKMTFIFVTHDQEEALTLSDRIAVMNKGVVEQVGTPQEIYEYPKTPFVARFIGHINAFEGEVKERTPEQLSVVGVAAKRPWTAKPSRDGSRPIPELAQGARVQLLVRPEKVKLLKSAPGPDQNHLEGTLKDTLYLGPITQYWIQLPSNSAPVSVVQANSAVTAKKAFAPGEKVHLAWAPEDIVVMPV